MATNPTVEKLKVFGLNHGEKLAMGLVAVIFVLCAYLAATHKSIALTPDEVKKSANDAKANIRREQKYEVVVEKLEQEPYKVKLADFEKVVDTRQNSRVDSSKYNLLASLASPEPGAGLIRDMPQFLAPEELYVYANRGAVKVFALDENGDLKLKPEPKNAPARTKKSRGRGGAGGLMGGPAGGRSKKGGSGKQAELDAEKAAREAAERAEKGVAGKAKVEEAKEDAEDLPSNDPDAYIQENSGFRLVTLVGKFNHKLQRELYSKALKLDLAQANPHYLRLDVERQEMQGDGKWSNWSPIDRQAFEIFKKYRVTSVEEEWVPQESRIESLVDPLPHFEVGYWVGAHHGDLLTKEIIDSKAPGTPKGGPGGVGGAMGPMGGGLKGGGMAPGAGGGMAPGGGGMPRGPGGNMMPGGGNMMPGGGGGGGGGGNPGTSGTGDYQKSGADWIMIRALDMNVKADASYRYRVRIYFENPNWHIDEALLTPGTDSQAKEKHGPWSEPTAPVNVPGDVATYALKKALPGPGIDAQDAVQFQVVKWNDKDGYLFVKTYDQSPGQVIGDTANMSVPNPDKPGTQTKNVDFVSHQILADALGGDRPASDLQDMGTVRFESPALAVVMNADGTLVLRDQSRDATNGEMAAQKAIFDQFKKDMESGSKKKGKNSSLGMGGGMMGPGGMGGPPGMSGGSPMSGGAGGGRPGR